MGFLNRVHGAITGVLRERIKSKDPDRSPRWPEVRFKFLKSNPMCAACGATLLLQVHHVKPFHEFPELELDPGNLITLCSFRLCHREIGHGGSWEFYNPQVRDLVAKLASKLLTRPSVVHLSKAWRQPNSGPKALP